MFKTILLFCFLNLLNTLKISFQFLDVHRDPIQFHYFNYLVTEFYFILFYYFNVSTKINFKAIN